MTESCICIENGEWRQVSNSGIQRCHQKGFVAVAECFGMDFLVW